jgi:hypothetical protein
MFESIQAVANFIGERPQLLSYLEKIRNNLYSVYYIPKKNGKRRQIVTYYYKRVNMIDEYDYELEKYSKDLERVHEKINNYIFKNLETPDYIMGFKPGVSIIDVAKRHVRKKLVISLDIKDFFPSIHYKDIFNVLKDRYGFGEYAAWIISKLVTYKNYLPQGTKTSPMASNIAFLPKDEELYKIAAKYNFTYTRYADDITISTNEDYTEEEIEKIINEMISVIEKDGFKINRKKIKIYPNTVKQYVLGMVVNRKLNLPKDKKKLIRAMIHNYVVKNRVPPDVDPIRYKKTLMGKLNYLLMVNPTEQFLKLKEMLSNFDPTKVIEWQFLNKTYVFN